jgi:hypothetical protein
MNLQQHITQLELAIAEVEAADEIVAELVEQVQQGKKLYEDCQLMEAEELLHIVGQRVNAVMEGLNY